MSVDAISKVLALGHEVSGARRLILIALADNMNDDGYAYPKRRTIADKAGIRRLDTVTAHLSWLESAGYIERKVNAWAGTLGDIPRELRPNVYRFTAKILSVDPSAKSGEGSTPAGDRNPSPESGYPSADFADTPSPESGDTPSPKSGEQESLLEPSSDPLESSGGPAGPAARSQAADNALPDAGAASGATKIDRSSDVPACRLARWITGELQPKLDYDDRSKLPDGMWARHFLAPSQQLLAARSEDEIREAVEFALSHRRHWRKQVRTPADLYAHWVLRVNSGFERDLLNWRANIEDDRPAVQAPELTLAAKPAACLDPELLAEGEQVAGFLSSVSCPVELRRAARAAEAAEAGVIARLVASSIGGRAYAGTIIHDLMVQNEHLDSSLIQDPVAFMRSIIRTACQSAEVAA